MIIQVEDSIKTLIARHGANKLLGVDYDTRQNMSDEELIDLFDRVWMREIKQLIINGIVCTHEEAARRLDNRYHSYIDNQQ